MLEGSAGNDVIDPSINGRNNTNKQRENNKKLVIIGIVLLAIVASLFFFYFHCNINLIFILQGSKDNNESTGQVYSTQSPDEIIIGTEQEADEQRIQEIDNTLIGTGKVVVSHRLYQEPGYESKELGMLKQGQLVELYEDPAHCDIPGWVHVSVDGTEGYATSYYIFRYGTRIPVVGTGKVVIHHTLRSGPGFEYKEIAEVAKDQFVELYEMLDDCENFGW